MSRSVDLRLEIGSRGLAGPAAGPPPAPGTLRGPREAGLDRHRARHLVPESIIQAIATTLDRWADTEIGMWIAYPDESLHQIGLSLLTVTPGPVGSRRGSACRDAAAVVVRAGWQLFFLVVPMVSTAPRVRESRRASGATSPRREMGPTFRRTRSNG